MCLLFLTNRWFESVQPIGTPNVKDNKQEYSNLLIVYLINKYNNI